MSSTICVIVPTYNRADLIRESIDSILAQTRAPNQILVVNDGSTDETEAVVKSYGDRVTLISKKNGGRASAINAGLAQCTCDYVWILDDDDIGDPNGLARLAQALDADASADYAYGTYSRFHTEDGRKVYSEPVSWCYEDEPSLNIRFLEGMFTHLSAVLVRHTHYLKTGPYREEILRAQDFDMAIRLSRGARAVYVPEIIFYYREHDGVRGTAGDRFAARDNIQKWLVYEQRTLSWARQNFSLHEFTPSFARQWNKDLARRAALLQRACVFAKRTMWQDAIDDLNEAARVSSEAPSPEEVRLAERVIKYLPPWEELCQNPEWLSAIRKQRKSTPYGKHVIFAAVRPMVGQAYYWLKTGNIKDGLRALRIVVDVLGLNGACYRGLVSILK